MKVLAAMAGLLLLPGCTSLSLRGERVRLTTSAGDVIECREIGEVQADPPFGTPDSWSNSLRNQAAELNADVVLHKTVTIGSVKGTAYDCGGRYAR